MCHILYVLVNSNAGVLRCYFKKLTIGTAQSWPVTTRTSLEQVPKACCAGNYISAVMEMFSLSTVQYSRQWQSHMW